MHPNSDVIRRRDKHAAIEGRRISKESEILAMGSLKAACSGKTHKTPAPSCDIQRRCSPHLVSSWHMPLNPDNLGTGHDCRLCWQDLASTMYACDCFVSGTIYRSSSHNSS